MVIFKFEMRQLKKSIIMWSLILSAAIYLMLPVYIKMVTTAVNGMESFGDNVFFESIGVNMEILSTPMGIYYFLTFFIMFACAINGFNKGLNIMTKEYKQNSADFLMTKPWSRGNVYISKFSAVAIETIIIGIFYTIISYVSMVRGTSDIFNPKSLILIAVSITLVQLLFLSFGMLIGTIFPKIRATLPISAGVVFVSYATGSMSRIVGINLLRYFSPLHYFNGSFIISTVSYEGKYVGALIVLLLLFFVAGYQIFCKKDIMLVS
jgi:ABC-2 type transport system permease protein